MPKHDGTFQYLNIEKGASISALNVIPDFYMIGASRNTILNMFGAAILVGGMVMPVGHGFFRFLTRKNRKKE
jgi:ABC-type amino acid transport system permease subunit